MSLVLGWAALVLLPGHEPGLGLGCSSTEGTGMDMDGLLDAPAKGLG